MSGNSTNFAADFLTSAASPLDSGIAIPSFQPASPFADPLRTTQPSSSLPVPELGLTPPQNPVASPSSGWFTVGGSGNVSIDYLFDGGALEGELGIFSLSGLEAYTLGSNELIQEVTRRVLSQSTAGYLAISDALEGARFNSGLGWEGNFNSGAHLGVKTFTMNAGDRFGIVTVANGTFQELLQNPNGGKFQTLFSIAEWNPNGTQQFGQLTSDTSETSVFAFEDLRLDIHSDRDYNDMVFQIRGATATAIDLSDLIDDTKDWLSTDLGQKIIAQTRSYIAPGKELPGDPTHPALPDPTIPLTKTDQGSNILLSPTQIHKSSTQDVIDQVSSIDQTDIYQVKSSDLLGSELSVLSGNLSVSFLTPSGQLLGNQVLTPGTHLLQLPANLPSDVLIKIDKYRSSSSTYILKGFESQTEEPFNINLEFSGGLTAGQRAVMQAAAKSVEAMIAQGLPSAIVDGKIIDDLNIKISTANLDGLGETQARTKIDFMRYGTLLPAQSLVQFDISDIAGLEKSGNLFDVAQHEFLHALGFGNLWEAKGLVNYAGTPLAQYNGKNAVEEFQKSGGMTDTISLETEGNGSASLHWHQQLFPNEIMTADLNGLTGEPAPISAVTIASLADLGYEVNLTRATPDYQVLGSQSFDAEDLTPEQIAAFRLLTEMAFDDPDADYVDIAPILPTVNPDTVAPEIWAHATRFWKNKEYYDWVPYQVKKDEFLSHISLRTMGSAHPDYYNWIASYNGIPNPDWIVTGDWIQIPVHHPNYEWKQEQERLRREAELRQRQEEEARRRREQEEAFAREQERVRQEEEARRREAEAKQRELEEQERRLREEIERRRQEEERRLEEARLAELARQAEIARQKGKGGLDWYLATPLPEFGPVDPFETRLTGETVGNLVPDDYYRFTLSRNGRITAELRQLLADADLVLYDVRNRPIAYSMREGITDEHLIADLIPGTYMLRVNSPKGVTTDYELIVKFKHLLSRTEQGPPEGWHVGGGNNDGGVAGPLFSDPRIQRIYDTALKNFADPERAKANAQIAQLEAEKRSYQQQMQALLDQMNAEQRAKVHRALDDARHNANVWVDNIANPIKNTVDTLADGIINQANTVADGLIGAVNNIWDGGNGWIKDRKEDTRKLIRQGQDAVKSAVNNARSWLKGELGKIQDGVKSAVWHFFETIKNAYRTGAEINQIIANAANAFRSAIDGAVRGANELVGKFKGQVLSAVDWTRNLGINIDKFGIKFNFNVYNQVVEPAVNAISGGVSSTINGIGNSLKGITDWLEPRTQKVVADVVNALFGDQTGHLWNKIHGVDAKIAATRTGLEKAISAAKQHIANIARQIEAFLSDPEERKRVLDALFRRGYQTAEDAYNFVKEELPKVRDRIAQEAKEAFEKAKRGFADLIRSLLKNLLPSKGAVKLKSDLKVGIDAAVKGGYIKPGVEYELSRDGEMYTVSSKGVLGFELRGGLGSPVDGGVSAGIADQEISLKFDPKVEAAINPSIGLLIKHEFVDLAESADDEMIKLAGWIFKELPTPADIITDPIMTGVLTSNLKSIEVIRGLEASIEKELVGNLGAEVKSGLNYSVGLVRGDGGKPNAQFKLEGNIEGERNLVFGAGVGLKSSIAVEASDNQVKKLSLEIEGTVSGLLNSGLITMFGANSDFITNLINNVRVGLPLTGKGMSALRMKVELSDFQELAQSSNSLYQDLVDLTQVENGSELTSDILNTVGRGLRFLSDLKSLTAISIEADTQQLYSLEVSGKIIAGGELKGEIGRVETKTIYSNR